MSHQSNPHGPGRNNEDEHPSVVIDRLLNNPPHPPAKDPRGELSAHHSHVADAHHSRRMNDHVLRMEAWRRTLADERARLAKLEEEANAK